MHWMPCVLERTLERKLRLAVQGAGGWALKWTSPGQAGVPDRVCLFPGGRVVFVEMKAPGGRVSAVQARVHLRMREMGMDVRVIDSEEGIHALCA